MAPNETNAPTPRGPEDEKVGERRDEAASPQREQGKQPPPSPLDKPATPDANPIDPRVGQ